MTSGCNTLKCVHLALSVITIHEGEGGQGGQHRLGTLSQYQKRCNIRGKRITHYESRINSDIPRLDACLRFPPEKAALSIYTTKPTTFHLGSFREMPPSPHQSSSCTAASRLTAGGSGCCPLISHSPLCFKSIVNYLQKALFLSSQRSGQHRAGRNLAGRGIQCYAV